VKKNAKIPATKSSRITVGSNHYKLEPAVSRTHYGEHRQLSGGQPYAFPAKRADQAWFVMSEWSGNRHGLVQQWNDGEWTFSKIEGTQQQPPNWLRAQLRDTPSTIYNLSSRLYSGGTPQEAIARGLGISSSSSSSTHHSTRKSSTKGGMKIQVGDLVRYKGGYGGTYVVIAVKDDRAKIRPIEGYKGLGATVDVVDLWKFR
jgi:hypothetical protein